MIFHSEVKAKSYFMTQFNEIQIKVKCPVHIS